MVEYNTQGYWKVSDAVVINGLLQWPIYEIGDAPGMCDHYVAYVLSRIDAVEICRKHNGE